MEVFMNVNVIMGKKVSWPGKFVWETSKQRKARKAYFSKDFWEAWFYYCECESPRVG